MHQLAHLINFSILGFNSYVKMSKQKPSGGKMRLKNIDKLGQEV